MENFQATRRAYVAACREILRRGGSEVLSEAAFPSYAHHNPLINHLFWERLRRVLAYVSRSAPYGTVLDYGCGGGAMFRFLSLSAARVIAADIDLSPARAIAAWIPIPANVELFDVRNAPIETLPSDGLDLILALDVLEHVEDLDGTIGQLYRILRPGGKVVVSGPTENSLYKLGRRLAGREFTGSYHVRDVETIGKALAHQGRVDRLRTLYPLFPLFKFFVGTR